MLQVEIGSIVYGMGIEKFRNEFMPQEGIPAFVWFIDYRARYNLFLRLFVKQAEALKSGEKPKEKSLLPVPIVIPVVGALAAVAFSYSRFFHGRTNS